MSSSPDMDRDISGQQGSNSTEDRNNGHPRKASDTRRVLACGTCRKRKLKCDSKRPKCGTCARLGHSCTYDEVRKKSGPKRGYVKELEARLKQVETLLVTQQDNDDETQTQKNPARTQVQHSFASVLTPSQTDSISGISQEPNMLDPHLDMLPDFGMEGIDDFSWDMVALGLEEPLPSPDVMDELNQIYFEKIHPAFPMIHRPRFLSSLNFGHNLRPAVCLRYIMWAHACTVLPKYESSGEIFYQKARKYIQQDEMRGHGESFVSVVHAQTWNLITMYEFKFMYFPRAWVSAGRATRLCQLMGLNRLDRIGLDVKQTIAPPKDWIEREERRRTFWVAFCQDRYASVGTGWPLGIDERDVLTDLPASEEAFLTGRAENTPTLASIMSGESASALSSFAAVVFLASLFGRNLTHLHRPSEDDSDHDLNGEFWKRHRNLDNIILNTSLSLPSHLRLPQGLNDPNIVFTNMNIHTSAICLHQAAIFKADKYKLPPQVSAESKRRCIIAADQITNIMKMTCHQDLAGRNPVEAFSLYVAARVFIQYLKSRPDDSAVISSFKFLMSAMQAMRRSNPLTESFIVQLDVDLEGSGLQIQTPFGFKRFGSRPMGEVPENMDSVHCSPIFEIRESQAMAAPFHGHTPGVKIGHVDIDFGVTDFNLPTQTVNRHPDPKYDAQNRHVEAPPIKLPFDDYNLSYSNYQHLSNSNTSPQNIGGDVQSNSSYSGHPTPSLSSNHLSSHSSYASPQNSDSANVTFPAETQMPVSQPQACQPGSYVKTTLPHHAETSDWPSSFAPPSGNELGQGRNESGAASIPADNPFDVDFGTTFPTGMTPGHTGMTPGSQWDSINIEPTSVSGYLYGNFQHVER